MPSSPGSETQDWLPRITDAAQRLAGVAVRTPLLGSPLLDDRLGGRVLVKAECLQRTGSFKLRGAFTKISRIPEAERRRGVVAFSSGNHAQGVAAAARHFGIPATIVMPSDAPAIKIRNTRAWGAAVRLYDRDRESREAIGDAIAAETGAILVRPYDDPDVISGQGTIGLEIVAQCAEAGIRPDAVLVPCGGGGLSAGISLALADRLPGVPVHPVEPAGFDDTARSLAAGERLRNEETASSLCDAIMTPMPGEITFPVNRRTLAPGLVVDDAAALAAMACGFSDFKLVIEPGGAVALAAALTGACPVVGRTVVVVASGGNVDAAVFVNALETAAKGGSHV
ncbi:MAG: pyridoxal-phosphate dependent enzyme [Alphaproteobacteria bacterium]|jgi:threonine dehydratase|nr:pyridoxal-phosphate dependent enzyme [Alphaproteobacteria bacterium]